MAITISIAFCQVPPIHRQPTVSSRLMAASASQRHSSASAITRYSTPTPTTAHVIKPIISLQFPPSAALTGKRTSKRHATARHTCGTSGTTGMTRSCRLLSTELEIRCRCSRRSIGYRSTKRNSCQFRESAISLKRTTETIMVRFNFITVRD